MPARTEGFFDDRVELRQIGVAWIKAAAPEQTLYPRGDPGEHDADLFIRRRGQGPETERVLLASGEEDAIEEERMEMNVQTEAAAEALNDGHASGASALDPVPAGAVTLEAEQRTHIHADHRARQRVIPRQKIAKTVREAQHPLAHGYPRQHFVDETRGRFGHAPAAAARTEAPPFAGERYKSLERAVGAPEAREAVRQHAAGQEVSELLFHELRQG